MLKRSLLLVGIILLLDQILKVYIKTHFTLGQELFLIGSYFRLHFIENNGMAFGMQFGGAAGKIILSVIRIIAVTAIFIILLKAIRKQEKKILIFSLSFILAGATGNIIDSAFYGLIFSESDFLAVATAFPEGGGYAGFLQGKVVDMFYAPLFHTNWPAWVPIFGGNEFMFFRPIFNIADSSITTGVLMLLIFYNKIFSGHKHQSKMPRQEPDTSEDPEIQKEENQN